MPVVISGLFFTVYALNPTKKKQKLGRKIILQNPFLVEMEMKEYGNKDNEASVILI